VEVVIGEESLMHLALVVVVVGVATLDEIETETEIDMTLGEMNLLHLEVEAGVEGVVEVIGIRDRRPLRAAHPEEETGAINFSALRFLLLICNVFLRSNSPRYCDSIQKCVQCN